MWSDIRPEDLPRGWSSSSSERCGLVGIGTALLDFVFSPTGFAGGGGRLGKGGGGYGAMLNAARIAAMARGSER